MLREKNKSIIISYLALRRLIGILGMLLPFICIIGGFAFSRLDVQQSISFYYHTNMRDFFVGLMICISMFLITYKGYEKIDNLITTITGIAGFGIALFPCLFSANSNQPIGMLNLHPELSNKLHTLFAALFFFLMAINSIFLFTLNKKGCKKISSIRRIRNFVYILCGIIILLSLITLSILLFKVSSEEIERKKIVLLFEIIMLFAFGISWLIKGESLIKEKVTKV